MNQLLEWLSGGDLRSDGIPSEVADLVLEQLHLIPDLLEGLEKSEDVIRGRTADALEKVARERWDIWINFCQVAEWLRYFLFL